MAAGVVAMTVRQEPRHLRVTRRKIRRASHRVNRNALAVRRSPVRPTSTNCGVT